MYKYETAIGAAGGVVALVWLIALAMGQAVTAPSGSAGGGPDGAVYGVPPYLGQPMYALPGFGGPGFEAR
jgi:hypothetical protein